MAILDLISSVHPSSFATMIPNHNCNTPHSPLMCFITNLIFSCHKTRTTL
jgi:hypothetical protein